MLVSTLDLPPVVKLPLPLVWTLRCHPLQLRAIFIVHENVRGDLRENVMERGKEKVEEKM